MFVYVCTMDVFCVYVCMCRCFVVEIFVSYRLMFWTDWEIDNSRIERCTMAGENRKVLWPRNGKRRLNDGWTNGIAVDYIERRLFWADAKYVQK